MKFDIVRAWKDEEYRKSLSEEELLCLPENPVGELELSDADLESVYGGRSAFVGCNSNYCSGYCPSIGICISVNCSHAFICF